MLTNFRISCYIKKCKQIGSPPNGRKKKMTKLQRKLRALQNRLDRYVSKAVKATKQMVLDLIFQIAKLERMIEVVNFSQKIEPKFEINQMVTFKTNNGNYDFTNFVGYVKSIRINNNIVTYDVLVLNTLYKDEARKAGCSPHKMFEFREFELIKTSSYKSFKQMKNK